MRNIVKLSFMAAIIAVAACAPRANYTARKDACEGTNDEIVKNCEIGIECNNQSTPCEFYINCKNGKVCALGRKPNNRNTVDNIFFWVTAGLAADEWLAYKHEQQRKKVKDEKMIWH